jgi:signal transduction histidine kinase
MGTHAALLSWCRDTLGMVDGGCLDWRGDRHRSERMNRLVACGARSFEVRSNTMERGGQVLGFTDVTDMLRSQASLQETAEMLERHVAERTGELVEVNRRLEAEVDERRLVEAQLLDAKTAAERANLSKTSFLAAASHDLLQPLNAARLFVAALGDRRLALPTRALVNQTSTALDSVEDLLEALLEISRLDAGAIQPEIGDFRLDRLIETLRVEFAPMARSSGLELHVETEVMWVRSDIRLLRRILQNFLSNALRYTQRGSVRVRCRATADSVRVSVADTGPGIAADKQSLIFEEFRRFDNRQGGKGLGLAIVKRASDMLKHCVTLDSAPGRGSVFSIDVPLGQPVQDGATQNDSIGRDRGMRGMAVLVIDNERSIQTGMRTLLEGWGCKVETAGGFDEAIRPFADGAMPDVVLIDYHLNDGETGDATMDRLNAHFGTAVPAIMISADRGEALKVRLDERAIPLLNKPVKPAQLRALLRTIWR